jgi:hypothetical protein
MSYKMRERIILGILFLFSLFLIGNSITGYVVSEPGLRTLCSDASDCGESEVCCFFYGEDSGVCNSGDMCQTVLEVTQTEKDTKSALIEIQQYKEFDDNFTAQLVAGLVIFFVVLLVLAHYSRSSISNKVKS